MTLKAIAAILGFRTLQVIANLLFKWGSHEQSRFWFGFFGGHLFGVTSIILVMILYKTMNPNVAQGLCFGGAFLTVQLTMSLVYRSQLSVSQYCGIAAVTIGMLLLAMGKTTAS